MKKIIRIACLVGLFTASCKDEESSSRIPLQQSAAVQDQAAADAYFSDASDLSTSAYSSPSSTDLSGRTASDAKSITFTATGDTRLNGALLTLEPTGTVSIPEGKITIDFGAGQTDPAGVVRKGKIYITYYGYRFIPASYYVISFESYVVNGVKVEGTRTVETSSFDATSVTFMVTDENGKLTFADNTNVTRESEHSRKWIKGTSLSAGQWVVEGTASGITRDARAYSILITTPLIFKVECALNKIFIPSEGNATLTLDGVLIRLNYGATGALCDKVVIVSVNGLSQEVTVE